MIEYSMVRVRAPVVNYKRGFYIIFIETRSMARKRQRIKNEHRWPWKINVGSVGL
jgi:hypothetical protein